MVAHPEPRLNGGLHRSTYLAGTRSGSIPSFIMTSHPRRISSTIWYRRSVPLCEMFSSGRQTESTRQFLSARKARFLHSIAIIGTRMLIWPKFKVENGRSSFRPRSSDFLYSGQVNPEQPDFKRFPLFDRATAYECVIEPGDTLLIPANWLHHVRGLEKSITVSRNFFNEGNFTKHIMHILQNLPVLVEGINISPNWREELRIKWRASDFTAPDA